MKQGVVSVMKKDCPSGKKRSGKRLLPFLLFLVPALFPAVPGRQLFADMASQYGLSPRAIGMGNAVSAVIDDCSAVYYNPAGLALRGDSNLSVSYFHVHPSINGSGGHEKGFKEEINAVMISYKQNLKTLLPKKWERNITLGILALLHEDLKKGAVIDTSLYDEMLFPVFGRAQDILVVGAGLGVELHKSFYLGAGIRLAVTLDLQNITLGVKNLPELEWVFLNTDANIDTEMRPIVGCILRPWSSLRIAAVWRKGGPIGDVTMIAEGAIEDMLLPVIVQFHWVDFYEPDEIAGSLAYEPLGNLLLALELTYARWSEYNVPYKETPPGDPMRDIFIPRFGAEYSVSPVLKFQLGYYYQPSPVKSVQPYTNLLDTDKHVFSFAGQLSWHLLKCVLGKPLQFQLYFQYQHCPRRTLEIMNGSTTVWGYILNIGGSVQIPF